MKMTKKYFIEGRKHSRIGPKVHIIYISTLSEVFFVILLKSINTDTQLYYTFIIIALHSRNLFLKGGRWDRFQKVLLVKWSLLIDDPPWTERPPLQQDYLQWTYIIQHLTCEHYKNNWCSKTRTSLLNQQRLYYI